MDKHQALPSIFLVEYPPLRYVDRRRFLRWF